MDNQISSGRTIPVYNVSEITYLIKSQLEEQFSLIRIKGEISTFRTAASGHCYFNLKDRDSLINAVLFRFQREQLDFDPRDGLSVVVLGRISVYPQRGNYQIICETIEKVGRGDLLLMLEERKKKLAAEGLFDESRKKPAPLYPENIGVVTSAKGAALQDIIQVLKRRMNGFALHVFDSLVQGDKAAESLIAGLEYFNSRPDIDCIILARGGGSVEDLLAFSDEDLVRAVAASRLPLISGVGHEIDFSLADFASDIRAATPSAAAEIISAAAVSSRVEVTKLKEGLRESLNFQIERYHWMLKEKGSEALLRVYKGNIDPLRLNLDQMKTKLINSTESCLKSYRHRLELSSSGLISLSPDRILRRGFSLILKEDRIIDSRGDLAEGDLVTIKLQDGSKDALIQEDKK